MLHKAWSVLSKESTQYVPHFTSFLKLLKESHFLKGDLVQFFSILASTTAQVPKYIGKATACTLYGISQHKMSLLILYNQNKNVDGSHFEKDLSSPLTALTLIFHE